MKKLLHALALAALLSAGAAPAQAQGFPWHLYEKHTLAGVVKENVADAFKDKDKGALVLTKGRPYKVVAVYTGKSRPVSRQRKEVLELWIGTYGIEQKFLGLYENEYLFKEGGSEFWLPTQTPVTKYFPKELSEGEQVELYVQFVGGKREKDAQETDWIFLLNEFQKIRPEE